MKQPASFLLLCQSLYQGFRGYESPPTYGCLRFVPESAYEELVTYMTWLVERLSASEIKGIVNRARASVGKLSSAEAEVFVSGTLAELIARSRDR